MNELALFAGVGGGILASSLLGHRIICAVENDPYARDVLVARQNDGCLPPFPIWDDVQTFNGRPWNGIIDLVSGGFPCQDISVSGLGAGINGARSGLWREMARIIGEVRPTYAFVENVPMLVSRGLGLVLTDLAEMGYDSRWGVIGADSLGSPHRRERIWILAADPDSERGRLWKTRSQDAVNARESSIRQRRWEYWNAEPDVDRVVNGLPNRVDRLRGIGNAQVPQVAAHALRSL